MQLDKKGFLVRRRDIVSALCSVALLRAPVTAASTGAGPLIALLRATSGGGTISLPPGNYGKLRIDIGQSELAFARFSIPITIKSSDPRNPAVFEGMEIRGVEGLRFEQIRFDYIAPTGVALHSRPIRLVNCHNVAFREVTFDGDLARGLNPVSDGYATGTGLHVDNSTQIRVEDSEFFNFWRGGVFNGVEGLVLKGNDVHGMRSDGFVFAKINNGLIEGNYIHDFRRAPDSDDHPDMIQFMTINNKVPSMNIVMRNNFLNSGDGDHTQSIFMGNEAVTSQGGGEGMYYKNITIENNVIHNSHWHGITVGPASGVTIRNNTVVKNLDTESDMTPGIRVNSMSESVTIANNLAHQKNYSAKAGWVDQGNVFASGTKLSTYFVDPLAGADATLESFARKVGVTVGADTSKMRDV